MNKRVHEIAKERGLPAKEVLQKLKAAGIEVKAASSSVDEAVALRALGNGDSKPAQAPKKAASGSPKRAATSEDPAPATASGAEAADRREGSGGREDRRSRAANRRRATASG